MTIEIALPIIDVSNDFCLQKFKKKKNYSV